MMHDVKNCSVAVFVFCGVLMTARAQQSEGPAAISIVPRPVKLVQEKGIFLVDARTSIVFDKTDPQLDSLAKQLVSRLHAVTGYDLSTSNSPNSSGSIVLTVDPTLKSLPKEGYTLTVAPNEIRINGVDEAGVFYGTQTLFQILPPEIVSSGVVHGVTWRVPCMTVNDYPRFPWRGMHLDVGRHFFPVTFVKKYLDVMSMYKLNVFHWHLTEDQGWRIEIKRYPRLTQVGSWRKETWGDGTPYGGFYTQEEIRDVVAYAKQRHIVVVPEIEMPGHARAALASYPEYSCRQKPLDVGTRWGVEKEVYCAGNDSTFAFLENVLTEVFDLFPGTYIHIGGDECPKDRWKECPRCQGRIKAEGLKDEEELQSYFVKRIERFINSRGRRMIGWDEILQGGLAPNATVMSWRGTQGGIDAAQSGHDVVMTPTSNCYFDYSQSMTGEMDSTRALLPLDSVYAYEPVPRELTGEAAKHILGSQGNVWTEWIPDSRRVEYMVLPRICALSEMVWTQRQLRNFSDFMKRLTSQFDRFECLKMHFRVPTPFALGGNVMSFHDTTIAFDEMPSGAKAYYTLDGTEPTQHAMLYSKPVRLTTSSFLKAKLFLSNGVESNTVWVNFSKLDPSVNGLSYSSRYPGSDNSTDLSTWVNGNSGVAYTVSLPEKTPAKTPFSVRFDGFLTIEQSGLYTFYMQADSGSLLWVKNTELLNECPPDRHWWRNGTIVLGKGKHPISILDMETNQWLGISLEYEGPGIERQSIPARLFTRR